MLVPNRCRSESSRETTQSPGPLTSNIACLLRRLGAVARAASHAPPSLWLTRKFPKEFRNVLYKGLLNFQILGVVLVCSLKDFFMFSYHIRSDVADCFNLLSKETSKICSLSDG